MKKLFLLSVFLALPLVGCDWFEDDPTRPCIEASQLHMDGVVGAPVGTFTIREFHDDVIIDGASQGTNGAFFIAPSVPPIVHTVSYRTGTCFSLTFRFML